ncbi:phosphate ABC transporter, permease protein PstA [Malaciobacter molluscorum LMG 25693]|uniref:Phosphate transport system permease protein PstA n=1 Tax=Malaciobacter molluscorum LMG 25693 TaxID=870501 RepID=A0A2G1DL50_9BACT|nr:phosphate ABC transporter permease PstA [Malaciobacter molluscorum]AXX92707.1 phosphate ABC transporter, permease protein [Malaciobacter molluscorum LMG 25693]PHO19124.1 phosphate ABC transporter, permease protein PstA [Malaciobacter molluscorum LMG 25693]RXJ97438.1 phosphate ABC transporter, permease protein PstA [Malaciobacter molluscorum]
MRLLLNKLVLLLAILSACAGLAFLAWILITLFLKGITSFHFGLFVDDLISNGLRNLIIGQFIMAGLASLIGIPIGVLAGVYLQEYGYNSKFTRLIRDLNDIMVSAPSIVIGAFVYAIIVIPTGGASGFAGSIALTIMMIPIVINTTDNMLSLVPTELREAGIAIGASKYRVIMDIIIKAAKVGIMTGLLLSFARIIGETAPLLFTSGTSNYFTLDLTQTFPSLTVSIYDLANDPVQASRDLAWAASFILTVLVLMINLIGRYITRHKG